jgi:hypothetical protein
MLAISGDAAIRVLGTGPVLHREHADFLAAGQARVGVRHVQADALLAHDDRPDARARGEFQDVIDRVAEDDLDPLALEDLGDRRPCFHVRLPRLLAPYNRPPGRLSRGYRRISGSGAVGESMRRRMPSLRIR